MVTNTLFVLQKRDVYHSGLVTRLVKGKVESMKKNKFLKTLLSSLMALSVISTTAIPAVAEEAEAETDLGITEIAESEEEEEEVIEIPEEEEEEVEIDLGSSEEEEENGIGFVGFEGSADEVAVTASAPEGAFPEGTEMKAETVTDPAVIDMIKGAVGENAEVLAAVDITFTSEGETVQPDEAVKVAFAAAGITYSENLKVVHIHEEAAEGVEPQLTATVLDPETVTATEDGGVEFDADSFSIYAIVETGEDARIKVSFKGLNDADIATIYVKKDDNMEQVLYDPGAGTLGDGVYFRGWTTEQNYTTDTVAKTISEIRTDVSAMLPPTEDGKEVVYYAMLFKDYRITYLDENGISLGQEEVTFRADSASAEQSYTVNMGYTVQNENFHFEGWTVYEGSDYINGYTEGKKYKNNEVITITGDVVFSVYAPEGHWFIFEENGEGATYNAPQFVYSADTPTRPSNEKMIRNGYTFGGWFADKATANQTDGGEEYDFNKPLTVKTTVYARWIPKTTANYTVIIWKQNLAGDGYDFVEAIPLSGNVGSTINTVTQQGTGNNAYARVDGTAKQYTGFHLGKFDQNVTIRTEGNSILNVYYDRNEHTLQFQVYMQSDYTYTPTTSNQGTQYGYYNGEYIPIYRNNGTWYRTRTYSWGGYSYSNPYSGTRYYRSGGGYQWTTIKEIKALFGQPISDQFPIVGTDGVTYTAARWDPQSNTPYSEVLSYIDIMPNADVVFHKDDEGPGSFKNIYYYVEALPGETGTTVSYNGKTFVEYKHLECDYNWFTEAEDYLDLVGFTKYGYTPNNAWGSGGASTVYCYYTRNVYPINFMDGQYVDGNNNPLEATGMGQIATENNIAYGSDVSSHNSYTPDAAHTPAGYVFEGWYIDSACTHKYTFTNQPEGGITVYAKWRQKQYRVFLHVNYPEGATGNIDWGTEKQEMTFRISEGGHVSEPTGRGLAGFAFDGWYLDPEFTRVFNGEAYTINESNVTTPYNKEVDMTDTYDNNGNLIDPKYNSDATGYKPTPESEGQDRFWITKKLDIYAKWHATLEGASGIVVEYDANGGTGAPTDTHTYVDTAKAPAGAASKAPAGSNKVFGYWEVMKYENGAWVGTGEKVLPGDTFTVLKANAKVEDLPTPAPNGDTKKYTVQLKAVYIDSEQPTPTHIYWFKNDGTEAFKKYENLAINEGVNIESAPTREGYEFLGWARVDIGNTLEAATAWEADSAHWTQQLKEEDLYLYYATDKAFHLDSTSGTKVTQVAADEDMPYQAMFAVWKCEITLVFSSDLTSKTYDVSDANFPTDLEALVTKHSQKHLYGGYYKYDTSSTIKPAAYEAVNQSGYWGESYFEVQTKPWNELPKVNGSTYYIKEVPDWYLAPFLQYYYKVNYNYMTRMYLLTTIDDGYYKEVGFARLNAASAGDYTYGYKTKDESGNDKYDTTTLFSLLPDNKPAIYTTVSFNAAVLHDPKNDKQKIDAAYLIHRYNTNAPTGNNGYVVMKDMDALAHEVPEEVSFYRVERSFSDLTFNYVPFFRTPDDKVVFGRMLRNVETGMGDVDLLKTPNIASNTYAPNEYITEQTSSDQGGN